LRPVPQLTRAKTRQIPSGYEISTSSQRNFRLRLPEDCDGLQFLQAICKHPKIDLDVRIEAAVAALPYQKARLVAFVQQGLAPTSVSRLLAVCRGFPAARPNSPGPASADAVSILAKVDCA
jgi:hypothetical protein